MNNASSDWETSSFDQATLVSAGASSTTGGSDQSPGSIGGTDRHGVGEDLLAGLADAVVLPGMQGELFDHFVVGATRHPATETRHFLQHRRPRSVVRREGSTVLRPTADTPFAARNGQLSRWERIYRRCIESFHGREARAASCPRRAHDTYDLAVTLRHGSPMPSRWNPYVGGVATLSGSAIPRATRVGRLGRGSRGRSAVPFASAAGRSRNVRAEAQPRDLRPRKTRDLRDPRMADRSV